MTRPYARCASLLAAAFAFAAAAEPLGTAFTYQGELRADGIAPTGAYDLRFTPFLDAGGTVPAGAALVVEDVAVVEGIFTTAVDFGPKFFVGDRVFVELAVRPGASADPNAFELLLPRQELTPAPYALKTAPGSVTDIELAGDAVGAAQVADGSLTGADITNDTLVGADIQDLSLTAADVDASSFNQTFWRVGGNPATGAGVLGTTDNVPLSLVAPIGVTINGARANNSTELTLRGNPNAAEPNADLSLWPRAGTAFFNLSATGTSPADARFQLHSVGTDPFTGFVTRLIMDFDGSLGIGNMPNPLGRLHIRRSVLGLDAADVPEAMELVLEDADAQLGLYSSAGGSAGSVIGLAELDGTGALANQWGLYRRTTSANAALQLAFGTNGAAAANPVLFHFGTNASLALGAGAPNLDTELYVGGSPAIPGGAADLALQPQGGTSLFNFSATGVAQADAQLVLQFAGPNFNYEPRVRFDNGGGVGFGRFADPGFDDSFVFADDSSATPFAPSAPNQFVVRASGGAALNGVPLSTSTELTVHSDSSLTGARADLALHHSGAVQSYRLGAGGTTAANSTFLVTYHDPEDAADPLKERFVLRPNGYVSINPATPGGGYILPGFPLSVGTSGTANGNGAHVTTGGVWTNGSSRAFKEAFTAIDVADVLDRVLSLAVTRWRYRGDGPEWHLGPVAEDFHAAFGLGGSAQYIGTVDADGVALAAIQGLAQRDGARIEALERENAALRAGLDALAARLSALEAGGGGAR